MSMNDALNTIEAKTEALLTTRTPTYRDELARIVQVILVGDEDTSMLDRFPVARRQMEAAAEAVAARVLRDVRDSFAARPEMGDETGQVLAASIAAAIDTWAAGKGLDLTEGE